MSCFFFNDTATTEIYTYGNTLSLHDALPILHGSTAPASPASGGRLGGAGRDRRDRSPQGEAARVARSHGARDPSGDGAGLAVRRLAVAVADPRRSGRDLGRVAVPPSSVGEPTARHRHHGRSEEHTSELQSLMRISYAVS